MSTDLAGNVVVVLGGSSGIGLATAELARRQGAEVYLTGRDPDRLAHAVKRVGAVGSAAFDATDHDALAEFFAGLPTPVDHVLATAGGPYYARLPDLEYAGARRSFDEHLWLMIDVSRLAAPLMRPGGTLLFVSGTGSRHPAPGLTIIGALTAGLTAATANLALELAPVRINLIAAGFVDTPLSASLLGDHIEERREQLRRELPIGRVVEAEDVAALALHLMTNTALTGATYDIDGGQQLL